MLYERALQSIPGGVNSPVRAFRGVGGSPLFIERATGAYLFDADGNDYIDYVGSWGPMILGHDHEHVRAAISAQFDHGVSFGAPTELEVEMAEQVVELVPSVDLVRMVNSGTEATMSAIRLARAFTGRDLLVKFAGCYHGHADSLLVKAGSGALTLGVPDSAGVPAALAAHTLTLPYNDAEAVTKLFAARGDQIAAVIVEPVAGNMGCVLPLPGFLECLRHCCSVHGAVLIFDEVMTGFRLAPGGAQQLFGVTPDLCTLGKIIGGGLPVGAFGGRREIMEHLAPDGDVYQAGTLSGNPLAMAAGLATLQVLATSGFHEALLARTHMLAHGLKRSAKEHGVPLVVNHVCGMFGIFFTDAQAVDNLDQAQSCDLARFRTFFHAMLARGIYLAPSAYESGFVSMAHDQSVLDTTLQAADAVFAELL